MGRTVRAPIVPGPWLALADEIRTGTAMVRNSLGHAVERRYHSTDELLLVQIALRAIEQAAQAETVTEMERLEFVAEWLLDSALGDRATVVTTAVRMLKDGVSRLVQARRGRLPHCDARARVGELVDQVEGVVDGVRG